MILADDQGWRDLSIKGNIDINTPIINSLATDGVMSDRFYIETLCAPTRTSFLTGRYYARTGVTGVTPG